MNDVMNKLRIDEEEKHRVLEERVPPLDLQGLSQGQVCSVIGKSKIAGFVRFFQLPQTWASSVKMRANSLIVL